MYQRTGPNPELLELLARYLAGQVPLEAAANQWAQIYTALVQRPSLDASSQSEFTGGDGLPPFKEADRPKVYALLERVQTKLDAFVLEEIHESAREYLDKAGDSVFDKTVRLLANDVANTLGQQHVAIVWSYAGQFRDSSPPDSIRQCIEEVQQYIQDTFVDTTWPACPVHPNHPLDVVEGAWSCPRGAFATPLGELRRPESAESDPGCGVPPNMRLKLQARVDFRE